MFKNIKTVSVLLMSVLMFGCMSTKVKLQVEATDNLNLNQFEEALPVVLKIYQLSDVQAFKNASFEELWKSDKSVLANSLLTVEERTVHPSEKVKIEFEQAENARYVGLVALFRDRSDNKWRTFHDLNSGTVKLSTYLDVLVTSNSVNLPGVEESE